MFRIKKLDIFIVKKFGLLFVGTFFICQFVLMMQFLWRYVDELIGKGLSLEVLAQFFWYMGLMLVPQAFPLAILLSSLITFGNLGESSELTAIKAAGISLMQAFRSLIVIAVLISICSFYFQNNIGPDAYKSFSRLLISMKQKSPEKEIPQGIFHEVLPGTNIYVERKDNETGMLYDVTIYRMNRSYDDAAIILADSGMLQSTAEKKHVLLTLYSGEWFENMQQQSMSNKMHIPYRRETFAEKTILFDFDGEFNLADVEGISAAAGSKNVGQIFHDLDSIRVFNDSVGGAYLKQSRSTARYRQHISKADSAAIAAIAPAALPDVDSIYNSLGMDDRQRVVRSAAGTVNSHKMELSMKGDYTKGLHRNYRRHWIEAVKKFTLSFSCLIFFFIGAPLGAIIRKGGLGVPVIISVLVFIVYYILENTGVRMARDGHWALAYGLSVSTFVLSPLAFFVTYKANKDSALFNIDFYRNLLFSVLGIRPKRSIWKKEVIISDPAYEEDVLALQRISTDIEEYEQHHKLLRAPHPLKVFFHSGDDHRIEQINADLEAVIADLSNAKDGVILKALNSYPIMATHAHTRPFRRKWLNVMVGVILPLGLFFYLRMWRFRLRLHRDLKAVRAANDVLVARIEEGLRERAELSKGNI